MVNLLLEHWLDGSVISVVLTAVYWDLKYRKIPNPLTFMAMVFGILPRLVWDTGHWSEAIFGIIVEFIALFPFFALGGIGAGDVKLMMAVGAMWGPRLLIWVILLSDVAGGILPILKMIREYGIKSSLPRIYLRGLMFYRQFPEWDGMLFYPCWEVNTFWMRFRLDVVMMDSHGRILRCYEAVPLNRIIRGPSETTFVMEVPEGTVDRLLLRAGDILRWDRQLK